MVFNKPSQDLNLLTTMGTLTITKDEYFIIEDGKSSLVINKEGTQKIVHHLNATVKITDINQVWLSSSNFSVYVKVTIESNGKVVEKLGSANPKNLSNNIAQSYPVEMAAKRAEASAALELLRVHYIGKETMPLLFSAFDEFKAENSINADVKINSNPVKDSKNQKEQPKKDKETEKTQKKKVEPEVKTEVKTEVKSEDQPEQSEQPESKEGEPDVSSSSGDVVLTTSKYRQGIKLSVLKEKDESYFNWLVNSDSLKGKMIEYQQKALEYLKEIA